MNVDIQYICSCTSVKVYLNPTNCMSSMRIDEAARVEKTLTQTLASQLMSSTSMQPCSRLTGT